MESFLQERLHPEARGDFDGSVRYPDYIED